MRLLCISFSRLLVAIRKVEVQFAQLDDALFYFGCGKDYFFDKDFPPRGLRDEQDRALLKQIREAVSTAEAEGRALWHPDDHNADLLWSNLNQLLTGQNLSAILLSEGDLAYGISGFYSRVGELVQSQKIPVQVIGA
ncbi:MAG: hypothetical protein Q7S48_02430 [bacterium]|nr:hypothetical protein [bacterium]